MYDSLMEMAKRYREMVDTPRRFSMEQEQWIQRLAVVCNADWEDIANEYERNWFNMEFMYDQCASGRVQFIDGHFVLNQNFRELTASDITAVAAELQTKLSELH